MKKERIHIDLDQCACDYVSGANSWRENFPDELYPQSHLEFWVNLKPIDGFLDSAKELEKYYDVYFLTAPSVRNSACWTGKAIWIKNTLGEGEKWLKKLIISHDKSQFKGKYLIDDGIENGQSNYEGVHLRFSVDEKFKTWKQVVDYIIKNKK